MPPHSADLRGTRSARRYDRTGPRHVVHWRPDEWARHQAAEDEARRRQRAGERQSAASACLVFVGLLLAAAVTGSAAPVALLAVLVAVGVALIVRDGLGNWFRGR